MNTLMFFYTLAILVICIVTAVLSLAAYASSRRRFFIYGSGVFICYAIEMTEIFFGSVRPGLTYMCPHGAISLTP